VMEGNGNIVSADSNLSGTQKQGNDHGECDPLLQMNSTPRLPGAMREKASRRDGKSQRQKACVKH